MAKPNCKALALEAKALARKIDQIAREVARRQKDIERLIVKLAAVNQKQSDAGCF